VKLQQLRYICEVARRGLNVTTAAERLFTAQSGISTQIRLLEEELNVQIFERHGKRLTGITAAGETIIEMAERILTEADNIRQVAAQMNDDSKGTLSIATTHTQAYHSLPPVIARFSETYPDVKLRIHQGDTQQIFEMLLSRTADVAVCTATNEMPGELVMLPYREWNLTAIVPKDHPLRDEKELSLELLAKYPLITYDHAVAGRAAVNHAFTDAGLFTNIALTALDSDIIKKYVKLGLGVGLIAETAIDEYDRQDGELYQISAAHLFRPSTSCICVHRGRHLRSFVYAFISLITPQLSEESLEGILRWESNKTDKPPIDL
jgi:LysR family cys regulon transcriptional activator